MFHVPEQRRVKDHPQLASTLEDGNNGAFYLLSPEPGWVLMVIASDGMGWEHVSVHAVGSISKQRTPTWKEMQFIKTTFWDDEDVVMQLHPKKSEYVNNHPHTLHLWRPTDQSIPTPPSIMVGVV